MYSNYLVLAPRYLRRMAGILIVVLCLGAAGVGLAAQHFLTMKPAETPAPASTPPEKPKNKQTKRTDLYGDPLPPGAVARMGSLQLRHEGAHLAFSADGKTLTSAGWDRTVRFWNVGTGRQVRQTPIALPESRSGASLAGLSPDGKIVAAFAGESVYLYDTATGKEQRRFSAEGIGRQTLFSADGKWLATLSGNQDKYVVRLWDLTTGAERLVRKRLNLASTLTLSSDGKFLAYDEEEETHVLDTVANRELCKGRVGGRCRTFTPDGRMLATANYKGTVTLWETVGLKKRATLQPSPGIAGRFIEDPHLAFSPDGKRLAVGGLEALVVWDVAARKECLRLADRSARGLVFSADGKTLACAGQFEIRLWNALTGERLQERAGHDAHVRSVTVSPDGKIVASVAGTDPVVRLWDAATGKPQARSPRPDSWVRSVAFAADGRLLVSGGFGVVRLLERDTGAELRRFVVTDRRSGRQDQEILVSHFSPDGKRLAVVSDGGSAQLSVWDARTGERLTCRPFRGGLDTRFTPDGEGVTVAARERLIIEDTLTGQTCTTIAGDLGDPVAFSPDGQLVAVGIHKTIDPLPGGPSGYQPLGIRLAEAATGAEIFHIDGRFEFAAISPDGRRLLAVDTDILRLWDVATGDLLLRRALPEDIPRRPRYTAIASLAFLPNGRAAVTGMNDGTILVWDLAPETGPKTDIAPPLDRKQLDAAWSDLAGDARKAHRAIYTLAASAKQALPFLAEHLRPVASVDAQRVEKLLADLDSEQFSVREAAAKELTDMGRQIEPALQRVLDGKPSLEVRNRVRAIQETLRGIPSTATLRTLRAIRVLEHIGTAEARQLLRKLADGAVGARETREAKTALERLAAGARRPPSSRH
jgi:WD40 repeat protein